MKKQIIILALILSAFISKATNFSLVIATTDTAYAHWYASTAVVDSDQAHLVQLGTRPIAPIYDSTNSNHSTWATAAHVWDSSSNSIQTLLATHTATNRTNELTLLASIGYGTGLANIPVDQWIMVQSQFATVWIGYATNTSYIQIAYTRPVNYFPIGAGH